MCAVRIPIEEMLQPRKRRLFTPATPNDVGTAAKLLQIEKIIKSDSEKSIIVKFANLDDQQELLELTIEAYLEKQPEGIIMHSKYHNRDRYVSV